MQIFMYACMYVCVWLNSLECAVGDWQHPRTSGQIMSAGRAKYISFLGQGTNIHLPLSGVSVLSKKKK